MKQTKIWFWISILSFLDVFFIGIDFGIDIYENNVIFHQLQYMDIFFKYLGVVIVTIPFSTIKLVEYIANKKDIEIEGMDEIYSIITLIVNLVYDRIPMEFENKASIFVFIYILLFFILIGFWAQKSKLDIKTIEKIFLTYFLVMNFLALLIPLIIIILLNI